MAEATWGDANDSMIEWKMSAALENVTRSGEEVPEVTNLEGAVRAWQQLEGDQKRDAVLTLERPIRVGGDLPLDTFVGAAIEDLARKLPA
jgi:hypothetical protein